MAVLRWPCSVDQLASASESTASVVGRSQAASWVAPRTTAPPLASEAWRRRRARALSRTGSWAEDMAAAPLSKPRAALPPGRRPRDHSPGFRGDVARNNADARCLHTFVAGNDDFAPSKVQPH